ncbi:hypothetical protein ZPR_3195 [Zunongwangia profunda SM-A87]|uniref:Uncharacterized protein n=1 Tax=Zunongwangia profunda (strain DSM 18752 / CCTCC AB 206139 / SM-A87) TaxID=655815 RepID=D5BIA0_ZUNPS|nr:hypothetical protein ZPR_3195 [Zunongwangia profunda SM-A87]
MKIPVKVKHTVRVVHPVIFGGEVKIRPKILIFLNLDRSHFCLIFYRCCMLFGFFT